MKNIISEEELSYRQSLPLSLKVRMTEQRIREFVRMYGEDGVYISFSGGKDSTVLMDIIRNRMGLNVKAVFLDTWLENPKLRAFVKNNFDNIDIIKPSLSMKEIIAKNGWCFPSKDVAEMIEAARRDVPWAVRKINGLDKDGNPSNYREQYIKWQPLLDIDILISDGCCIDMKEKPVALYEEINGLHPIVAIMADESARRKEAYLRTGCNLFDTKRVFNEETGEYEDHIVERPISKPMGFWTENDVLQYIYENKTKIAPPYGTVVETSQIEGQLNLFDLGVTDSCTGCRFKTTGEKRTGCIFCPVGCHLDGFDKYKRLSKTFPKLYEYCMEELGMKKLLYYIDKLYVKSKTYY